MKRGEVSRKKNMTKCDDTAAEKVEVAEAEVAACVCLYTCGKTVHPEEAEHWSACRFCTLVRDG